MTTTTNLGITLLDASQAQKEITINQALVCFDAISVGSVADKDLAAPPGSPVAGVLYIVAASPTGAWAGHATHLAYYDQLWNFIVPQTGSRVWVQDEARYYQFSGTAWVISGGNGDMVAATYDPANIAQQVAGTSATQTLTNKTISGASNTLTVRLANDVTGTLPVANGGTGQTSYTDGQLLIGSTAGNTLAKATLTAGSGISVTNAGGAITIAATAPITQICQGRLTLTSNTPVTTTDVLAATTLYFTPYSGSRLALYDGTSAWSLLTFTQLSIAVPATTSTMYDVFAYNNAGVAALEVLAWTNDSTRATALVFQDGVYVKSGATTRRYLGSFRTTGTSGQSEDSLKKRYVWNYYNRVMRPMQITEATGSWTYSTTAVRMANGNSANQLDFVLGVSEDSVRLFSVCAVSNSTATVRTVYNGMGIDTTTALSGMANPCPTPPASGTLVSYSCLITTVLAAGRHYVAWLEYGAGTDTQTWYGTSARGLNGEMNG